MITKEQIVKQAREEIRDRLKKETNPNIKQEARIISLDTKLSARIA